MGETRAGFGIGPRGRTRFDIRPSVQPNIQNHLTSNSACFIGT